MTDKYLTGGTEIHARDTITVDEMLESLKIISGADSFNLEYYDYSEVNFDASKVAFKTYQE